MMTIRRLVPHLWNLRSRNKTSDELRGFRRQPVLEGFKPIDLLIDRMIQQRCLQRPDATLDLFKSIHSRSLFLRGRFANAPSYAFC